MQVTAVNLMQVCHIIAAALLLLLTSACAQQGLPSMGEPLGWEAFNPMWLPLIRNARAFQASSSDPTGGNDDKGHFLRAEKNVATLLDVRGTGCIYRIWSANPMGELRIYIDNEKKPSIQLPFRKLFAPQKEPFIKPLVGNVGGGYCYVPLPFSKSAKVEVVNPSSLYYQITYHLLPDGLAFRRTQWARSYLEALLKWMCMPHGKWDNGQWARGMNAPSIRHSEVRVPPKGERTLLSIAGSATIVCLSFQIRPATLKALHSIRMRAFWDGESNPSIDVPLADLLCIPFGWVRFNSAFVDTNGEWLTLRLPMPFARSALILALNDGYEPTIIKCVAWLIPLHLKPNSFGTLHAWFNCDETKLGVPHNLLHVNGFGHLVGLALAIVGNSLECLEGDLNIKVDDDAVPSIRGTGTEDEFNGGWYFILGEYATPFAGAPLLLSAKRRASLYRWMLSDCIPFKKRIEASIEHGPKNSCAGCIYRSVTFWYQVEPHSPLPMPPPIGRRMPPTFKEPNAIEAEEMQIKLEPQQNAGQRLSVINEDGLPAQLSGGKGVAINDVTEAHLTFPIHISKEDTYDIAMRYFSTDNAEAIIQAPGLKAINAFLTSGLHRVRLFRCRLNKGELKLQIKLRPQAASRTSFVVDYLQLEPLERARGAIEAEELNIVEGRCSVNWQGTNEIEPYNPSPIWEGEWRERVDLSGGGYALFEPSRHGRQLSFEFDAQVDGSYEFAFGLITHPSCGRFKALVDGRTIGGQFHGRSKKQFAWHQVGLGPSHPLRSGKHILTIESVDGKPLLIDYVVVQPAMAGYQAERMFVVSSSRQLKIRKRFGAEPPWRGGAYLKLDGQSVGEYIRLLLPIFKSGIYALSMTIACMPSGGIFEVSIDGAKVGEPVNSYSQVEVQRQIELGSVKLKRGFHELELRAVGKEEASGGYTIGCDEIGLELLKASIEVAHITLAILMLVAFACVAISIWLARQRRPS